ncbi:replication fork protection component Swi3-domain-containing protein [Lipomyces japonicus]|uniref:replication fork protection component Swi3-domain-containing protein n=1 Tax=Lipomyces japonicus TaxID=56871 RepID=UPI0034CFAC30
MSFEAFEIDDDDEDYGLHHRIHSFDNAAAEIVPNGTLPAQNSQVPLGIDEDVIPGGSDRVVANDDLGIDTDVVVKPRKAVAKLDVERLLSVDGLLDLRVRAQRMRFKGKGHEYKDLGRLLECYQLWAHNLFPKAKFADFLQTTERLGRTGRMKIARNGYIDEYRPKRTYDAESNDSNDDSDDIDRASKKSKKTDDLGNEKNKGTANTYEDESGFVVNDDLVSDEDDNDDDFMAPLAEMNERAKQQELQELDDRNNLSSSTLSPRKATHDSNNDPPDEDRDELLEADNMTGVGLFVEYDDDDDDNLFD